MVIDSHVHFPLGICETLQNNILCFLLLLLNSLVNGILEYTYPKENQSYHLSAY